MKKIYIYVMVVLILGISTSGCRKVPSVEKEPSTVESTLEEPSKEDIEIMKNRINVLEESRSKTLEIMEQQVEIISLLKLDRNDWTILPIYNADIDTYERYISYYIKTEAKASLQEKIESLCQELSRFSFGGLPIEYKEIQEINEKKIAIIDIREFDENIGVDDITKTKGVTWRGNYFQGSTGGLMTSTMLIESLLQRELQGGDWIDGVKFLYNGTETNDYRDHVDGLIGKIHYRQRDL